MNDGKSIRLDRYYAARQTPYGLRIFCYFEERGEVCERQYPAPVILGGVGQAALARILAAAGHETMEGQDETAV